jgi:hypothetical protein
MPLLKKLRVMAAAVETTAGTAETLAGGDAAFNAYNVMAQPTVSIEERESQGSFNRLSSVPGTRMGKITFRTDWGWDGTTTMPTWASALFPMCGVVESSQVYTPRSEGPGSNVKTGTLAVYVNGLKKQIRGAVGNFSMVFPTGRIGYIDWEFTGVWDGVTDAAILSPTYPTAAPIRYANSTTTYKSVTICNNQITLNCGNTVTGVECEGDVTGFKHFMVTDRYPKVTINPEAQLVASLDVYGDLLAGTESALSIELDGPSSSTITLSGPKAQIINAQESDRDGVVVDDIELALNKNGASADQEFSLTFSETA